MCVKLIEEKRLVGKGPLIRGHTAVSWFSLESMEDRDTFRVKGTDTQCAGDDMQDGSIS